MPVYTYHCDQCDHEFEKYQSFSEDSLIICPKCGRETLRKIYQPALVLFKGSGFYVTDTKSHSSTLTSSNHKDSSNGDKPSSEKSSKEPAEKKTEAKSEKKTIKDK
jgi:putative FmdB family regulatory protein